MQYKHTIIRYQGSDKKQDGMGKRTLRREVDKVLTEEQLEGQNLNSSKYPGVKPREQFNAAVDS